MTRLSRQPTSSPDLDDPATWHYELPAELIASRPAPRRDDARLMVVDRSTQTIRDAVIRELPSLLSAGDVLVFNNTRVLKARIFGERVATGGRWEGLVLEELTGGTWKLMCETRGRLQPGETVRVLPAAAASEPTGRLPDRELLLTLLDRDDDGCWTVRPNDPRPYHDVLAEFGCLPLPPYIGRRRSDAEDETRYQTCFATRPGAIAAPTAGLHFTPELFAACSAGGIRRTEVTLHVGVGTFRPIKANRISEHAMHAEWCDVPGSCCEAIADARASGGRVIPVGTTSVRTLESLARESGVPPQPWQGQTRLFIRPPFGFRLTDALLTNFHLPGSTLLIMIAALAGYDLVMEAYRQAVSERYRFFSYGDAMLIL